jgi:hypothetical protein
MLDHDKLLRRARTLVRLLDLGAPNYVVRREVELIMRACGPRWLARLWFWFAAKG